MYTFQWTNPALPGKAPIVVPTATQISTAATITFTGKGSANHGLIQQQNLMRMLENSADGVAPLYPTIGQLWYDSLTSTLKVCTDILPETWEGLAGIQVSQGIPPTNPSLGDTWFDQTGGYTGTLYTYTGTGRYPLTTWDPVASSAFPVASPLVAPYSTIKINYDSFTNPNFGEAYIHGFTLAVPADVDGQINVNGVLTTMPRGVLPTEFPGSHFIVWDITGTLRYENGVVPDPLYQYFSAREVGADSWEYDNNGTWIPFTPVAGMWVIGTIIIAETDDDTTPGISSATIWQDARALESFRSAAFSGAVGPGGWNQIWPQVEFSGARYEFDTVLMKVLDLIGSPYTFGGNGADRGLALSDLSTLDAALYAFHESKLAIDRDPNFAPTTGSIDEIKMETTSRDWDLLLAAAKWAVARLDLPLSMYQDISSMPFTQDGRIAPAELTSLPNTDVRYPVADRLTQRRWGSITGARLYAETMNVLEAALGVRYTMRGIAGTNSTVPSFISSVTTTPHTVSTNSTYTGGAQTYLYTDIVFPNNEEELRRFTAGGSAIDVELVYSAAVPTPVDIAFSNFLNTNSRFRLVADNTYVFDFALALSQAPVAGGLDSTAILPAYTSAVTVASGGHSVSIGVGTSQKIGNQSTKYSLRLAILAPAGLTGTITVNHSIIRDAQTYGASVPFFPPPRPFNGLTDNDPLTSAGWSTV